MAKTFGVEDLAKLADIEVASARVMLRKQKVKKKGKNYEFASQDEMKKIIAKARPEEKKADKKKAPAKKSKKD